MVHYFKNLDAIRFIAAMMVFMEHGVRPYFETLPIKGTIAEHIFNTISNGQAGVSIFFVLSGFLITYRIIQEENFSLYNFYVRRIQRIFPLYYLIVIISFIVYKPASGHLLNLLFLSNFEVLKVISMPQSITWSVSIEEQFYLLWPLIFLLPKNLWLYLILLVIIASITFRVFNSANNPVLYFHTLSVLLDLAIGGLMAYLIISKAWLRSLFENSSTQVLLFLFVVSFSLIYFIEYGAISRIFISMSFALIISCQAFTTNESMLNLANFKFASRMGKYTYGIYLIHPLVITLVGSGAFLISLPVTLLLSVISYRYYESRFRLMNTQSI